MFKKLSTSYFQLTVWCLYHITNLCHSFLEPFILPKDLFVADFYLLEKNEYALGKGKSENMVQTCLKTFLSGTFSSYDCLVGCGCPGRPQDIPNDAFFWAGWWNNKKSRSYGRNKLASWRREFFNISPHPRKSQWSFSLDFNNLVYISTALWNEGL